MMTRTSLYLPESLQQRLQMASRRKKKSASKLAVELLDAALAEDENKKLDETYRALMSVKGIVKDDDPDASSSIDATLYGEDGAWRGEQGETGLWTLPTEPRDI